MRKLKLAHKVGGDGSLTLKPTKENSMSPNVFNILRTVLAALVSAIATFIVNYFDQYGKYDYSTAFDEE